MIIFQILSFFQYLSSCESVLSTFHKISKKVFEETLKRIFKIKSKKGKNHYEILDLMKKNMENNNKIKSEIEIKKFFNYFLKEF